MFCKECLAYICARFHHVCAYTWLGPHDCAHTRLLSDMFVPRHDCVQTWLCPDTLMPQHELWPDTIMSLDNNITFVSTRLSMCQLDWWKHKHAQLLLVKRSEMWLFNYCSAITSSIPIGIFHYFIIACQGTKCLGIKCVWAQTYTFLAHTWLCPHGPHDYNMSGHKCVGTNVSGHKRVWSQMCLVTNVSGHKRVWSQTCLVTNVSGHKRVWSQTCLVTNVSGHKRVWSQTCLVTNVSGHKRVWSQTCLVTNVSGHKRVRAQMCVVTMVWAQVSIYVHKCVVSTVHINWCYHAIYHSFGILERFPTNIMFYFFHFLFRFLFTWDFRWVTEKIQSPI